MATSLAIPAIMQPKVHHKRHSWISLAQNVFQGPMDNPKNAENKLLTQLQAIRREVFMRTAPEAQAKFSWGVFHPESSFRLVWDLILIGLVLEQAVLVPYIISFNVTLSAGLSTLDALIMVFFMLDVGNFHTAMTFNTAYFSKGTLIGGRLDIARNYLRLWFWLDMLASFPYSWLSGDGISSSRTDSNDLTTASNFLLYVRFLKFLRILRLLRLIKLKSLLMKIEDFIASNSFASLFVLGRISFLIFLIAHWIACGFYYVGTMESDSHPASWTTAAGYDMSPVEAYVTALYFAFTTMTTVGFGDIVPSTTQERVFVTCAMIISCCTFAYMIGSIGSVVQKQNAESDKYRERVIILNQYMRHKNLPLDLQFRVRRFLEYAWDNQRKERVDDKDILDWLSDPLKDEIFAQVNGAIVTRCVVFKDFEQLFVLQLSKLLVPESFAPGDVVFEEGHLGTKMYHILHGSVDVFHFATSSSFKLLGPRHYFGEIAFFATVPRCASTRCLEFTDLLTLTREDMRTLLQKYPDSNERARVITMRVANGDLSALYIRCYICKAPGHVATRCRQVLLSLDHEDVKTKWLHTRSNHTKYLNPHAPPLPNHQRLDKRPVRVRYDSKNVIGVKRGVEQMYPNEPLIVPAVRSYLSHAEREKNRTASTVDMKDAESENIVVRRRNRPRYTIIYKDSSSDEEGPEKPSEMDVSPQRPRFFRRSLLVSNPSEFAFRSQGLADQADLTEATDLSGAFTPFRLAEPVPRQATVRELEDGQELDHDEPFEAWDCVPPCSPAIPPLSPAL